MVAKRNWAKKAQQTGMQGVYLVAAALSRQGLIASPTSRSAKGADILVTDSECARAFSVQVKTNGKKGSFWLVGEHALSLRSESHIYALVNLTDDSGAFECFVVPSQTLAGLVKVDRNRNSTWWYVERKDVEAFKDGWKVFGV